jgi:hypothetical protein
MDKIELNVGGPYSSKQWQVEAPSTQFALWLYLTFEKHAKQLGLPPLTTKKSKQIWFDKIWSYAVNDLHIKPEENPHLAKLGEAAVKRNINARAEDKRAQIKKQIWNAFNGLLVARKSK